MTYEGFFTVAYNCVIVLMQKMMSSIAVLALTSFSKTMDQHTDTEHVRQLSYCSMKFLSLLVQTCDLEYNGTVKY